MIEVRSSVTAAISHLLPFRPADAGSSLQAVERACQVVVVVASADTIDPARHQFRDIKEAPQCYLGALETHT